MINQRSLSVWAIIVRVSQNISMQNQQISKNLSKCRSSCSATLDLSNCHDDFKEFNDIVEHLPLKYHKVTERNT